MLSSWMKYMEKYGKLSALSKTCIQGLSDAGCHSAPAAYSISSDSLTAAWGQEQTFSFRAKFLFQSLHLFFPISCFFLLFWYQLISSLCFSCILLSHVFCLLLALVHPSSHSLPSWSVCACLDHSVRYWLGRSLIQPPPKENLSKAAHACPWCGKLVLGTLRAPGQLPDDRDLILGPVYRGQSNSDLQYPHGDLYERKHSERRMEWPQVSVVSEICRSRMSSWKFFNPQIYDFRIFTKTEMRLNQFDRILQILGSDSSPKHELDLKGGNSSWTLTPYSKEVNTPGKNASWVFVTFFHCATEWPQYSSTQFNRQLIRLSAGCSTH